MRVDGRELPLSVSCFHVILGLPGPHFPSTCMSKDILTVSLKCSTCPYHRSLLSFRMRSRSSMPSRTSSSCDQVVTMSCSLTLQICLIIALSFHCRHWRFGFVNGHVLLVWSTAEEIWNVDAKCVKVTGARNIGHGHRVKVPAKSGRQGDVSCKV